MILGALEAGGTKMVCAVGDENGNILERASFPTNAPENTIPELIRFFGERNIEALGIGSFGPLDLNPAHDSFGSITTTPKPGWAFYPLRKAFIDALSIPVGIDTDVNAAALGEALLGAGRGVRSLLYYTVGTGIGGGLYYEGSLIHGLVHPEMGHALLRPMPEDPMPKGICPYHDGCVEGLACGLAIEKRWGVSAKELPDEHMAWQLEAEYLAQMCATAVCMLSPERIVLGGGVMKKRMLFPMIRQKVQNKLNGYVAHAAILEHIDTYIVPPALNDNSGAVGSLLLAREAMGE